MKVLAIGDVYGKSGCEFLLKKLPTIKKEYQIDLVIANGENSAEGNGILPGSAELLFSAGVDVGVFSAGTMSGTAAEIIFSHKPGSCFSRS